MPPFSASAPIPWHSDRAPSAGASRSPGSCAAALVAALAGFVSGWFLLRYRGLTLLMLTLAIAIMLAGVGQSCARDLTGGYDGIARAQFAPLFGVFDYDLYGHTNYLYVLGGAG